MPEIAVPAPARFLHHEVHYVVPNAYKGAAVVRAESVEEAEAVFRAEMPFLAEAKIIKVVVPRVLLR